jgi:hypothetical protein
MMASCGVTDTRSKIFMAMFGGLFATVGVAGTLYKHELILDLRNRAYPERRWPAEAIKNIISR